MMPRKPGVPVQEKRWEISGERYDGSVTCLGVFTFVKKIALNDNKPTGRKPNDNKPNQGLSSLHTFFFFFVKRKKETGLYF